MSSIISPSADTLVAWQEPEDWTGCDAGDRFRFTYGTKTLDVNDGVYNFEIRMQRYEWISADGTETIDTTAVCVGEAQMSATEARQVAALLVEMANEVER